MSLIWGLLDLGASGSCGGVTKLRAYDAQVWASGGVQEHKEKVWD